MSAADVLEQLHRDGLRVRTDGEKVLLGPKERVTMAMVELVRQHKADILHALGASSDLEARRQKVAAALRADGALRYAYDVQGASPNGAPSDPVSVALALRDRGGTIITGELTVPPEKWDMAAFIAYWDAQGRPS